MSEGKRVKPTPLNREIRKGLVYILRVLVEDFDNGFEQLFPEATDEQVTEICAAIEWLNQHTHWQVYE